MARAKKKQTEEILQDIADEVLVVNGETAPADEAAPAGEAVSGEASAVPAADAAQLAMTQEDVRLVEAILFATSSALTVGMIAERFPADRASLIPDVLEHLKEQYANRGVNLVQRESRWAFRTATDLADNLRIEKEQPRKFTRSAMETMAVVAYHQPVTRAEIENIRGVATSPGALDALMEAGWIKPGKRREVPGRPVTWLSTQAFLDHFGLERLEDLPGMEELKAAGLLDKRPAIEAMPTADMFGDDENKQEEDPQEVTDEDLLGKVDVEASADDEDGGRPGHDEDEDEDDESGDEDEDEEADVDDDDEGDDSDEEADLDDDDAEDGDADDDDDDDLDDLEDPDEEAGDDDEDEGK